MKAPNPESMFKPRQEKPTPHSDHPKTARNRENETAKRGIDIAMSRADTAFRVAKSRALAKLHKLAEWTQWNSAEQGRAERKAIRGLEVERDRKKTMIENEYRYRTEAGILESIEDAMEDVQYTSPQEDDGVENVRSAKKARRMHEETVAQDDGDPGWSDCEESWDLIGEAMIDINIKYERRRRIRVMQLNKIAERREREYGVYKAKRDAERMELGA
jgi:hypothetical protein